MSFKCPVISFDCDFGPREIIKTNVNGILLEQGNKDLLAMEMKRLLEDDNLHSRLSKNAFKRAKEVKLKIISEKWTNLLKD